MPLMTGAQYIESLKKVPIEVYALGERIPDRTEHPLFRPHINAAAETYNLAHDAKLSQLGRATSNLSGLEVNRFTHIHHSTQDLVTKVKMLRVLGQRTGSCFQRCVGFDGMNALYSITYDMDKAKGTKYHSRFRDYLKLVQDNDLMPDGAMTDPKGDRSLAPSQQPDPDQYLHIVERRKDGVVIRGAKIHQSGAVNSHEVIAMPTRALGPEDADYAIACAVPANSPGMLYIFGRQTNDTRKLEGGFDQGNAGYGLVGGEATVIFDNVFVPWERVFLAGEVEYAGPLVERFAAFHRQNYGGCKSGVADVVIGAAAALAEYQGVEKAPHVRDKLTEMMLLSETLHACSIACSSEGKPTPSGAYVVDYMLANVTKQNVTRYIYEIYRLAQDIAGGFLATMPSERDLRHPKIGPYVEKYYRGAGEVPAEYRMRLGRLLENMTCSIAPVESMHGAGSPQAQRVMILRQGDLEAKKRLAKKLAGLE